VVKYIPIYRTAVEATWDIVLRGLVIQTVLALLVEVILAVGAFPAGPNPRAVAIRGGARDLMGNKE
jgi:hypothetical protein